MSHKWKKLLLISPDTNRKFSNWKIAPTIYPNIGLEYLIGSIRNLIEIRYIDLRFVPKKKQNFHLVEKFRKFKPDLVGIFSLTPFMNQVRKIAQIAKKFNATVICGGWHPTLYPKKAICSPYIDILVRGDGELTFRELIKGKDFKEIRGISYKEADNIIHNSNRPLLTDLDKLDFPARDYRKNYFYRFLFRKVDVLVTSRGCPNKCEFCPTPIFYRSTWRSRTVENIISELEEIKSNRGARIISIFDDNFTANPKRIEKLCDEIIQRKLKFKFHCLSRAEFVANNPKILKKMKKAGFWAILIGFESFNLKSLRKLNKETEVGTYYKAIMNLKKYKILCQGTFLLGGNFNETKRDIFQNLRIIKKLDIDMVNFYYLTPQPNSELYRRAEEGDLLLNKKIESYNMSEPVMKTYNMSENDLIEISNEIYVHLKSIKKRARFLISFIRVLGLGFFINAKMIFYFMICLPSIVKSQIQNIFF